MLSALLQYFPTDLRNSEGNAVSMGLIFRYFSAVQDYVANIFFVSFLTALWYHNH